MSDVRAYAGVPTITQFGGMSMPSPCASIVVDSTTGYLYSVKTGDVIVLAASGAGGTGTVTHTVGNLTANALAVGNAVADLDVLTSLGTTTTLLHGNAAGRPTFGAVSLTADVSGTLPVGNGGTGVTSSTGSGANALATSPALVTPNIGAATGASVSLSGTVSLANTGGAATAGQVTLVGGTKTVNTTAATSTALIFFQRVSSGGTIGFATTYTVSAGVSFTVSSDSALDTSVYNWTIIETH